MKKLAFVAVAILCVQLYAPNAGAAPTSYMTVESSKQGVLKGDSPRPGFQDKTEVYSYAYAVNVVSGNRQHGPVKVVKRVGPATPQLFQALVNNEILKSVVIDFIETNASGQEFVANTVRLGSARVIGIDQGGASQETAASAKHSSSVNNPTMETIAFLFETIEIMNHNGKTSAVDSIPLRQ